MSKETVQKLLRLPPDHAEAISETAEERGVTQAELVSELVEYGLGVDDDSEAYLQRRLDELNDEEDELKRNISREAERIRDIREKKTDIRGKLADIREDRRTVEDIFDSILSDMAENPRKNIEAYRADITEAVKAEFGGQPSKEKRERMISQLREEAAMREDITIRPDRFSPGVGQVESAVADGSGREGLKSIRSREERSSEEVEADD